MTKQKRKSTTTKKVDVVKDIDVRVDKNSQKLKEMKKINH